MKKIRNLKLALVIFGALSAGTAAFADVAGCRAADFVEGGAANEIRIVGKSYSPKCLKIRVGASVTIDATGRHPLIAMPDIGGKQNPFAGDTHTSPQQRILQEGGVFGFYCDAHGDREGNDMAGAILVE